MSVALPGKFVVLWVVLLQYKFRYFFYIIWLKKLYGLWFYFNNNKKKRCIKQCKETVGIMYRLCK